MAKTNRITNVALFIFAIFIVVISIMNCIEYYRIINNEDTGVSNLTQAQWWFGFNIALAIFGCLYFIYRVYTMLNTTSLGNETIRDLKNYLTSENKPTPSVKKDGLYSRFKKAISSKPVEKSTVLGEADRFESAAGVIPLTIPK